MTDAPRLPAARIGLFYFLFFAAVGAFLPYWTLYLEALGFSATSIGSLMALLMATRIVAPNLWSTLSDRHGRRLGVMRFGACAAVIAFACVPFVSDVYALALVIVLYSVFWSAVLPQFEALTLTFLGGQRARYSRLRLWGSVGFVLTSLAAGVVLEHVGIVVLPWILLALLGLVALMTFALIEPARADGHRDDEPLLDTLRKPAVVGLLIATALMQASHGPYYVFFSIHLEDQGFERSIIGGLWSLAVIAEVVMFALLPPMLVRYRPAVLFLWCFALTAVRWLALAWLPSTLPVLLMVQLLHAVSFGAYHAIAIEFVHRHFPARQQARGQALYSSLSFGAGGAVGSVASGWLWAGSGAAITFTVAAVAAALGGLAVWCALLGARSTQNLVGTEQDS